MTTVGGGVQLDSEYVLGARELVRTQSRIIVALMLRDLKTRYFGTEFGFLISIAWPLVHILILLAVHGGLGRAVPYGDNAALWFATGIVPFMAFSYMSRFILVGIVQNRPLLSFPKVKVTDLLFARAILETLSAGLVVIILITIFSIIGIDVMPRDPIQAVAALGACMLLGLGAGVINSIVAVAVHMWASGYRLLVIVLYLTSGVYFVPHALPETLRYFVWFNPLSHGIEWMRSAYYEGYGTEFISKPYILGFGAFWLCAGLLLERAVRGRLLHQ
jgi:capsular polysaccharide transport system permease protein